MKLIITNTEDSVPKESIKYLIQENILEKLNESEYIIELPIDNYPSNSFSISGDTLYYGLQWIGTLSKRLDQEITVHFNKHYAKESLNKYLNKIVRDKFAPEQTISLRSELLPETEDKKNLDLDVKHPEQLAKKFKLEEIKEEESALNSSFQYALNTFFSVGA